MERKEMIRMLLEKEASLCDKNAPIIPCEEYGKKYIAHNPKRKFNVRKYKLDGVLVTNQTCCDYLVLDDSNTKAYYVELKGQDIQKAIEQLEAAEKIFSLELGESYKSYFRIVPGKVRAQELNTARYRKLERRMGSDRLRCKALLLEENLG